MATPIRFKGLVKTTTEIESDKFEGRIGFNTTLARYVAYYNATQYAVMARRDVLETFSAGIAVSTLTEGRIPTVGAGGILADGPLQSDLVVTNPVAVQTIAGQPLVVERTLAAQPTFASRVVGDAYARMALMSDGALAFGPPTATYDTYISRGAANQIDISGALKIGSHFTVGSTQRISAGGRIDATSVYSTSLAGATIGPAALDTAGQIIRQDAATFRGTIGAQAAGSYVVTNPVAVQTIAGQPLVVERTLAAQPTFASRVVGDAYARIALMSDGALAFGPPTAIYDTYISRGAAGRIDISGALKIASHFTIGSTQRISDVGRADFSSLYVSALAGGGVRPTLADNVGMVYATDAATFRGTIGAVGIVSSHVSDGASVNGTTEQDLFTPQSIPANSATSGASGKQLRIKVAGYIYTNGTSVNLRIKLNGTTINTQYFSGADGTFMIDAVVTCRTNTTGDITGILVQASGNQMILTYLSSGLAFDSPQDFVITSQGGNAGAGSALYSVRVYSE